MSRLYLAAVVALLLVLGPPAIADTYQARPSAVFACLEEPPFCGEFFQVSGSLGFDVERSFFPGTPEIGELTGSNLTLDPISQWLVVTPTPFPSPGGLTFADLVLKAHLPSGGWLFVDPPGSPEEVEIEIHTEASPVGAGYQTLLVRGVWREACCDGFEYHFITLFDRSGAAGEPPALSLGASTRFEISAAWHNPRGGDGFGTPVTFDERSGHFWFFDRRNPELMVKVIDGCVPFGSWWFFAAGLTDVEVRITVKDHRTNVEKLYTRPAGVPFQPILDTVGFPCL